MPTENELKFVLRNDDIVKSEISKAAQECLLLEQGYMHRRSKLTVRIRKQTDLATNVCSRYLQTKLKVKRSIDYARYLVDGSLSTTNDQRVIEVGQDLDERDFLDFWRKAKGKLRKYRYCIRTSTTDDFQDHHGKPWQEVWEVDFFQNDRGMTYLVVAECELPEKATEPLFGIPDVIRNHTVFRVPLGDSRFSSSRLGNIKYANQLYNSLLS